MTTSNSSREPKRFTVMPSPVGDLILVAGSEGLEQIGFTQGKGARQVDPAWSEDAEALAEARSQLEQYFAGQRRFFNLPLVPQGTTFQQAVWQALTRIPFGETRSYAQIAALIDRPKAVRAVGAANGANPLPIVVPCHRVIGASGKLTGFGGGLPAKQHLLALEGAGITPAPEPA